MLFVILVTLVMGPTYLIHTLLVPRDGLIFPNYAPSSILNGDFNKDGYEDLIIVSKSANELRHLQTPTKLIFVEQTGDDLHLLP